MAEPAAQPKGVRAWISREVDAYRNGAERPLGGYVALVGGYVTATATLAGLAKVRGSSERLGPAGRLLDVTLLAVASHKVARLIAKDPVTSPLRVPFTKYEGTSADSELKESVRGHGMQHAVGELLTCPLCLGQWVATGFAFGLVLAPKPTRFAITTASAVAGADFLHHAYAAVQQASE